MVIVLTNVGEIVIRRTAPGCVTVVEAAPRIRVSALLLLVIAAGRFVIPEVTFEPHRWSTASESGASAIGGVLRVHGTNRTVVYRITGLTEDGNAWTAEWPD